MADAHELVDSLIVPSATPGQRQAIHDVLDKFPVRALERVASAGARIRPLAVGERFDQASKALAHLGAAVDSWPTPPGGLFVVEDRTIYLRSMSPMTIAHEFGHALDMAIGDGLYASSHDLALRREFARAASFVTPYAASALDEWFAEGFRSYVGVNDSHSFWPSVNRERLWTTSPRLAQYFDKEIGTPIERELPAPARAETIAPAAQIETAARELDVDNAESIEGPAASKVAKRNEFYQQLTSELVALIERGGLPEWERFWTTNSRYGGPHNATTNAPYRGVNTLRLWLTAAERGYEDPRWMTVKQANSKGWAVRAGEIGTPIEVWKKQERYLDRDGNVVPKVDAKKIMADPARKDEVVRNDALIYRIYTVFNAAQVDAVLKNKDKTTTRVPLVEHVPYNRDLTRGGRAWEPNERAETIIEAVGVKVTHVAQDRAYYAPGHDTIVMPEREQFKSASDYYDVKLHETGHATGHESRLNRPTLMKGGAFGSEGYAREELRAELASFYMAAEIGIPHNVDRHGAYLEHWTGILKGNHMEIYAAAKDAQAAVDFMLERENELIQKRDLERSAQTRDVASGVENLPISALALDGERDPLLVAYDRFAERLNAFESVEIAMSLGRLRTVLYHMVDDHDLSRADVYALEEQAREIAFRASNRIPVWHSLSAFDAIHDAIKAKADARVEQIEQKPSRLFEPGLVPEPDFVPALQTPDQAEEALDRDAGRFRVAELTLPAPSDVVRGEFRAIASVVSLDPETARRYGSRSTVTLTHDAARWAIRNLSVGDAFACDIADDGIVSKPPERIARGPLIPAIEASLHLGSAGAGDQAEAARHAVEQLLAHGSGQMEWPADPTRANIEHEAQRPVLERDLVDLRTQLEVETGTLQWAIDNDDLEPDERAALVKTVSENRTAITTMSALIEDDVKTVKLNGWPSHRPASVALAYYDHQERSREFIRRQVGITDLDPRIVNDIIQASYHVLGRDIEDPNIPHSPLTGEQIAAIRRTADLGDLDMANAIIADVVEAAHGWELADGVSRNRADTLAFVLNNRDATDVPFETLLQNMHVAANVTLHGSDILIERPWLVTQRDDSSPWHALRDSSRYARVEQQLAVDRANRNEPGRTSSIEPRAMAGVSLMLADDRTERMRAFIGKLRDAGDSRDHVWSACMNEIRSLKTTYEVTTVRRMMTEYRKAVAAELGSEHPAMPFLRAYRRDREAIEVTARERIAERLEDRQPIDPEHVAAAAEALIASEKWPDRVAGVILATGTRVPEVAAFGRFIAVDEHSLTFDGAVRGSAAARTIPTLVNADLVVKTIDALREQKPLGDKQATQITASHSKPITAAASAALGATYTATELRDLYATVAHEWYAKPTVSLTTYVAGVLGHEATDATTALSHVRYYPEGKERETLDALERSRLELVAVTRDKLNSGTWSVEARQRIATELDYLEHLSFESRDAAPPVEVDASQRLGERLDEAIALIEGGEPGAILAFVAEELENTARPVANPTGRQVIAALRADGEIAGEIERTQRLTRAVEDAPSNARRALNTRQSPRFVAEREGSTQHRWVVRDTVTGATYSRSALSGEFTPESATSAREAAERLNAREARDTHAYLLTEELAPSPRVPAMSLLPERAQAAASPAIDAQLARDNDYVVWIDAKAGAVVTCPYDPRMEGTIDIRDRGTKDAMYAKAAWIRDVDELFYPNLAHLDKYDPQPSYSLLPEVTPMPAPIGQRVTLYGSPTLTNMFENENVAKLGLRQSTSRMVDGVKQFESTFYDVTAFAEEGTALASAARATSKDELLRVEAIAHRGIYEKDGEKRRTAEFFVTKVDVVKKTDVPKDVAKNEWLVTGTVLAAAEVNQNRTAATIKVGVARETREGKPYTEEVTVKGFRDNVATLAALQPGDRHEFAGKVAVEKSRDEKHRDPVLLLSRHGQDLGIRKALGVEQTIEALTPEQAVATAEQRSITNEARGEQEIVADEIQAEVGQDLNGVPTLDHVIDAPAGRVVDRADLPYNMTGELVGQSPDGQHLYMGLGRGDLLAFERDSFGDVVPEFGKSYSFVKGDDGRENITALEPAAMTLDREHDLDQEHAMA